MSVSTGRAVPVGGNAPVDGSDGGTIRVDREVRAALERRVARTGFGSVEGFVNFVLARLVDEPAAGPFSEEEEEKLRERLRSLGYID